MKTEKDDRKVEKSYLIENWLTLNLSLIHI